MNRGGFPPHAGAGFYVELILRGVIRHPFMVLAAVAAISLMLSWHIPKLSFKTSVYDMVVDDLPETDTYRRFKETFGSDEIIRVVIKTDGVFTPDNFKGIESLSQRAEGIAGVRRVLSLPAIKKGVELSKEWPVEKFEAVIGPVELLQKNLISNDRRTTALNLILEEDADRDQVIADVASLMRTAPKGFGLYQIGMPLVSQSMARLTEKDFMSLPLITLVLVAVVLGVVYRTLSGLVMPLLAVVVSLVWTLGFMGWLQVDLSMLTMVVPVFLIAVGTAYCLHIISSHARCSRQTLDPGQAVLESYRQVTLPTILAVITTVIGLGSLLINRIPAIREFSLFASFGMGSLLIILLTAFPAGLVLFPQPRGKECRPPGEDDRFDRFLRWVVLLNLKHRKRVLLGIGMIVAVCLVGIFLLKVETNPVGFFKSSTAVSRHFHDIYQDLSGSFPINVVVEGDDADFFEDPAHVSLLEELGRWLETLPGIDKSVSFADYMKLVNYATNRYEPSYYRIPQEGFEIRMVINQYKTMLGEDLLSPFMNPTFSKANILLFSHLSSSRDFLSTREQILTYVKAHLPANIQVKVTGFGVAVAASSHLLTRGQIKSFLLTMVFIFVIMLLLFLSAKVGFIAILPNAFPIIVNFGIMGWLGIHLSMVTSLIASIAIGLAVDDTIHYQYRYSREFKKDLDKDRSMRDAILHIGRPILFTTLTICLGFSVLLFSHFRPTSVFGLLIVITMVAAVIGDLVILPALMLKVELVTAWDLLKLMPASSGISAMTAHELNQPLNVIKMGSDYLTLMLRPDQRIPPEQFLEVAGEIGRQVDRASAIVKRLTVFDEKSVFDREPTHVNECVRDAIALVDHRLRIEDIDLEVVLEEALPCTHAYPHKITEVVFNLLTNACDAVVSRKETEVGGDVKGRITVRTLLDDNDIVVKVEDTGPGIPAHLVPRITEPFYTTKSQGRGKGLGLSISKEIVKGCGGRIQVKSEVHQGTQITVTFPVHT